MFVLKRQPDTRPEDRFFYVHLEKTDAVVGGIFSQENVLPPRATHVWYWCISMPHYLGNSTPWYGNVRTRDEAMAAFRARWLLSNPIPK